MPFLRARARSLAGRRELAEDLVQETAMRAWQFRRSFVPGTNMKGWLSTILRNQFYSHGRRDWREVSWTPELDATTLAPPERQRWTVELSDTACAMNALPDELRDTMLLVCFCGFSYQETAQLLMVALGTVKSRVGRGREFLTRLLDGTESRSLRLRPANGDSLVDWFRQIDRLEDCARRTLVSGNFEGFRAFRPTPRMAVRQANAPSPSINDYEIETAVSAGALMATAI
jgi:RNA polymerase sigma-70 factor (ECF subfamily)